MKRYIVVNKSLQLKATADVVHASIPVVSKLPYFRQGKRHTSTALYFYGMSKKSPHKPRTTSGNRLFHISYGFNYYLQLLCLQFLSKTHLHLKKITFGIKIALQKKLYHYSL